MVSPIDSTLRACAKKDLVIEVRCRICAREALIDPGWLSQKVNPLTSIHHLRLRCTGCQSRDVDVRAAPADW